MALLNDLTTVSSLCLLSHCGSAVVAAPPKSATSNAAESRSFYSLLVAHNAAPLKVGVFTVFASAARWWLCLTIGQRFGHVACCVSLGQQRCVFCVIRKAAESRVLGSFDLFTFGGFCPSIGRRRLRGRRLCTAHCALEGGLCIARWKRMVLDATA